VTSFKNYGTVTYALLFLIVFCETGLVVLPFLPGDSLLFAAGTFAAKGDLGFGMLFASLAMAAVLGDTLNYEIGRYLGPKIANHQKLKLLIKIILIRRSIFMTNTVLKQSSLRGLYL